MEKVTEKESLIKYLEENGLHIVKKSEFETLVNIAGEAYQDYPLCVHFSGGKYDAEDLKQIVRVNFHTMYDEGIIFSDSEELNGCVILLPPGYTGIRTLSFIWNGGFKILLHQGIGAINRMAKFESFAMNLRKKYTNNEDWYLYNLFVNKNVKGKKVSSKLIKPLINYFKLHKKICYLETNSNLNVPIYEYFGFKLMKKCLVPGSNVEHFCMMLDEK